jgi:putative membrane protein
MDFGAAVVGVLAGVLTGLIPGIHVNTITALLLISSAGIAAFGIDYNALLVFTCALAISHTFFDVIPGLFLGVPGDETFTLLPGHRLVKQGEGILAVKLSVLGSIGGLMLGILVASTLIALQIFGSVSFGALTRWLTDWMFWILASVSLILIVSDKNIFWSSFVFLISGSLGIAVMGSPMIEGGSDAPINALFPSLAGLFGIAGLVYAIVTTDLDSPPISLSEKTSFDKAMISGSSLKGGVAGFVVGLLPGLGAANAATLLLLIEERLGKKRDKNFEDKSYLLTTSSLNTSEALFSIAALYLIEKSRSGASIAVDKILGGHIGTADLINILTTMLVAGMLAGLIMWFSGRRLSILVNRMNVTGLNWSVIGFLVALTYMFLGMGGLVILMAATVVGLLPMSTGVRRAQLMGFFLVPTMLFYSGYQMDLVDFLSIEARSSQSSSSISLTEIFSSLALSLFLGVLIYYLSVQYERTLAGYRSIALCLVLATMITGSLTLAGKAYPRINRIPQGTEKSTEFFEGKVTRVIDGDTLEIGSLGRRYRIRLHGVDAPELSQPHGNASKDWLNENFNKAEIEWQSVGVDLYGRRLGIVYKDKNSVNRELVANGYAWVYPGTKIDFERLKAAEDAAFSKRVGLWGKQNPVAPWIWRKESHR